jgi:hypothetical protein
VSYEAIDEPIANPGRGFFAVVDMNSEGDLEWAKDLGRTLVNVRVVLSDYRTKDLDQAKLDELSAGFAKVRDAGLKAIVRFQYNEGSGEDAPLEQVLRHIEQLGPVLRDNWGVIAVLQAGFIGAWGEWHSSSNGLDDDEGRGAVLSALLAEVPDRRMVQVRSPSYKETLLPGGPLTAQEAHDGEDRARVGHHNDCLLYSESDNGTYEAPIDDWRSYLEQDGQYTVVGGEACSKTELTTCENALSELEMMHWSYLNGGYPGDVIEDWQSSGCFDEIDARLGYRLRLARASWSDAPRAGQPMRLVFEIENDGFAAPYNERPVFAVLRSSDTRYDIPLGEVDPRDWLGGTTQTVSVTLPLDGVVPGSYQLSLWLPDARESLRERSDYSIHLANRDVWVAERGINVLTDSLEITP